MTSFPPRVLSIRQPWAWAIFELGKDIENRSWKPPNYVIGSRLLIHAPLRAEPIEPEDLLPPLWNNDIPVPRTRDLPTGCIVGSVRIAGVVTERTSRWYSGPYGWVLEAPIPVEEHVPCRGRLGLWLPAREILTRIPELHWTG